MISIINIITTNKQTHQYNMSCTIETHEKMQTKFCPECGRSAEAIKQELKTTQLSQLSRYIEKLNALYVEFLCKHGELNNLIAMSNDPKYNDFIICDKTKILDMYFNFHKDYFMNPDRPIVFDPIVFTNDYRFELLGDANRKLFDKLKDECGATDDIYCDDINNTRAHIFKYTIDIKDDQNDSYASLACLCFTNNYITQMKNVIVYYLNEYNIKNEYKNTCQELNTYCEKQEDPTIKRIVDTIIKHNDNGLICKISDLL
jgi:hypothetical protein